MDIEEIDHAAHKKGIVLAKEGVRLPGVGEIVHLFAQIQKLLIQLFRPAWLDGFVRIPMVQAESCLAGSQVKHSVAGS